MTDARPTPAEIEVANALDQLFRQKHTQADVIAELRRLAPAQAAVPRLDPTTSWQCRCGQLNAGWARECGRCGSKEQAIWSDDPDEHDAAPQLPAAARSDDSDPEFVDYVHPEVYQSAVKGRADFRQALKEANKIRVQLSEDSQAHLDRAKRAEAEVDVLRRVVRAADYLVVAGQDGRYDEARAALTAFDRERPK